VSIWACWALKASVRRITVPHALTFPATSPGGIVDQWGAVLDDGAHDRPPAHADLLGHFGHRSGQLADLAARLRSGSPG
jgi:hypothetical protein